MFSLEAFSQTAEKVLERAGKEGRLLSNPSCEELRALVEKEPGIKRSRYGNFVAETEPTSRAARFTKNSVDDPFGEEELELLSQAETILSREKIISLDRVVGKEDSGITVRLIVPERFAHVALGGGNLFLPPERKIEKPTYQILFFADGAFEGNKSKSLLVS